MLPFKSLLAAAFILILPLTAQAQDSAQKRRVDTQIHDYLMTHPEVIIEAVTKFQSRQQASSEARRRKAVAGLSNTLKNNPNDPVIGNPNGNVTMVEFFDYRCGYCKRVFPDLQTLLKSDGNIRFVLKEFPILGAQSLYAARAAQAVWLHQPDAYHDFHTAMMLNRGGLDQAKVMDLARKAGVDTQALQDQINDPRVEQILKATAQQAQAMGFNGTPAFIIGNVAAPGAIPLSTMKAMLAAARKKGS